MRVKGLLSFFRDGGGGGGGWGLLNVSSIYCHLSFQQLGSSDIFMSFGEHVMNQKLNYFV